MTMSDSISLSGHPTDGPRVSVVMPAYNLATYLRRALDSVLAQQDVDGPVEIIVVDDGSSDETPSILAGYGRRITVLRQENSGLRGAVERGLREARGDYVALLDADDEWPPDRLARHLAALRANPSIALVHGDMNVIDRDGAPVADSFFRFNSITPRNGRPLGPLLGVNFVTQSAITFRRELLGAILPMPDVAPYPDWWIAVCAAAVGRIQLAPGAASRYRLHGDNMVLGATDPDAASKVVRRGLRWRLWLMVNVAGDELATAADHVKAYQALEHTLLVTERPDPRGVRTRIPLASGPTPPAAPEAATAVGTPIERSRRLINLLGHDPFDGAARLDLLLAAEASSGYEPQPGPPLLELSRFPEPVLAWLEDLVAHPELLSQYAAHAQASGAALIILAPPNPELEPLQQFVEGHPFLSSDACTLLVIPEPRSLPARRWLANHAAALLSSGQAPEPFVALAQI
jgi:hypothetical protein